MSSNRGKDDSVELLSVVSLTDEVQSEVTHHTQPAELTQSEAQPAEVEDGQLATFSHKSKLYHRAKDFVGCADEPAADGSAELKKELTVLSGVAFITGNVIGSGIFITPRTIFENTGSFGLTMVVWLIGAIIALVGGLCYIELAAVVRKSGGEYSILLASYSFKGKRKSLVTLARVLAFLYSWSSTLVIRSLSCSIILLTCARYLSRPFYIDCEVPGSVVTTLALALLCESFTHHTHTHTHIHMHTHTHSHPHTCTHTQTQCL